MPVLDVSHVELYVRDKPSAVRHLVTDQGFAKAADRVLVDRSSTLLCRDGVRLVVTSGWGTGRFLAGRQAAVAAVALRCDDPAAVRDRARSAGALVEPRSPDGPPVVSGLGGVAFALLEADADGLPPLPSGRRWNVVAPGRPAPSPYRPPSVTVRFTTPEWEAAAALCERAFGLTRRTGPHDGRDGHESRDGDDGRDGHEGPAGHSGSGGSGGAQESSACAEPSGYALMVTPSGTLSFGIGPDAYGPHDIVSVRENSPSNSPSNSPEHSVDTAGAA